MWKDRKRTRTAWRAWFQYGLMAGLLGCKGIAPGAENFELAGISIDPTVIGLRPGTTFQFRAYPLGASGDTLPGEIEWQAPSAGITSDGTYTAPDAVGDYVVVATLVGIGLADTARVVVALEPVASVDINPLGLTVVLSSTAQLTAVALDASGVALEGRTQTWSSSAPTVASVTPTGLVKGESLGLAAVTVEIEGISATVQVEVVDTPPPTLVTPVFQELWDYTDSDHMRSNPRGWFGNDKPPGGGVPMNVRSTLALDLIGPPGVGVGKSLRIGQASRHYQDWWDWTGGTGSPAYDPNGSYPQLFVGTTIGKSIVFPGGPIGTEMWVEVWYRLSPGWNVAWADEVGTGASEGLKMMFFGTSGGSNGRLEVKLFNRTWAVGESTVTVKEVGLDGPGTNRNLPFGTTGYWPEGFNDVWHYWRVHIKGSTSGNRDGFFRFHDGKQLRFGPAALGGEKQDLENRSMDVGNGFDDLEVGINMNVGPWNTNEVTPATGVSKTTGYVPGNPYPGQTKLFIPSDWQTGQFYWFGPIRVWTQDPGWGW